MAKPRLLWRDAARQATVTASSTADGTEAAALTRPHLSDVWQCTGSQAAEWIKLDLGSAVACGGFALIGHDLDGTETGLTLQASTTDDWASPPWSLSLTHQSGVIAAFFSEQTYRWWRFTFTKASAADLRSAGRLMLGPSYEITRGPRRDGFRWGHRDLSTVRVVPGGQAHADAGAVLRTLSAALPALPQADVDELQAMAASMSTHTPWFLHLNPDLAPSGWALYGRLTRLGGAEYRTYDGGHLWDVALEMEECA